MTIKLEVASRDEGTKVSTLRANGVVPAVVYGPKQEALAVTASAKEFEKVRKEAGESTIVELSGVGETIEVLIKDVEFDPVKQEVTHVDFYAIERGKEMTTNVALNFIGDAPVEGSRLGTVNKVMHEIEVTCRPSNLPSHIDVDLSSLATIEDKIHVSDLVLPEGVTVSAEGEDAVAVVSPARIDPVAEDESGAVDMDSIEVEQKGKGEEVEAAE